MILSVNKEKLTGLWVPCRALVRPKFSLPLPLLMPFNATLASLWARNYATILQVLILKFAFGPGKFPGLLKNRPLISYMGHLILRIKSTFEVFCAWAWNFASFPKNLNLLFIVWYLGYFCVNFFTDKDHFIITASLQRSRWILVVCTLYLM